MNVKQIIKSSPAFIVPSVINLLSLVVLTRSLSLELYGQLSLALVSIEFFQGLFYQWVKLGMMRFYNNTTNSSVPISMQFNASISLGLILIMGAILLIERHLPFNLEENLILILMGAIGRGYGYFILDYIRIDNKNLSHYTIVSLLLNVCYYIPAIALILIMKDSVVSHILSVQVCGIILFGLLYTLYNSTIFKNILTKYSLPNYKEFILYGLPLIIVFIASNIFLRIDRYIIEFNLGLKAVGAYSAAFSLSNLAISSFFTIITLPTYPEIIRKLNSGETTEAKSLYDRNGNMILIIAVPLVYIAVMFNSQWCKLFFGDVNGEQVRHIFPLVVIAMFLYNYKVHYFDQVFQFGKKTKLYMKLGLVVGSCHLAGAFILTKYYDVTGVSISSIIINTSAMVFIYYQSRDIFPISINKKICLCLAMLGIGFFISYLFINHSIQ